MLRACERTLVSTRLTSGSPTSTCYGVCTPFLQVRMCANTVSPGGNSLVPRRAEWQDHVRNMESFFRRKYNVGEAAHDESWVVGRIAADTPEGKLNLQSVLLEPATSTAPKRLILAHAQQDYALFPGQVEDMPLGHWAHG
jgi:hypothetical protein